uniref:Uncharacterized protein n=1 Tax=Romanomermis culicivorax TaxID=13658 RepID=A0A915HTV6_ROMCU
MILTKKFNFRDISLSFDSMILNVYKKETRFTPGTRFIRIETEKRYPVPAVRKVKILLIGTTKCLVIPEKWSQ